VGGFGYTLGTVWELWGGGKGVDGEVGC